ncbi:MAG: metalloregulator ArsR/SmtB family transcription factor [Candidatus Moraniibacteriota bacterium]
MNEKKLIITKKGKLKEINKDDKMVQTFLTVVADRNRMKIIRLLRGQILTATQINLKLKLSQNLTSYHISKLKKISFLKERKEGTFRFYTVNLPKIREYNKLFRKQLGI